MDWPSAMPWNGPEVLFVESVANFFVWGNVLAAVLFVVLLTMAATFAYRRRRLWCVQAGRTVEVEFEEVGLPGHRRPVAVHECSAFSPPTNVTCDRRCLDLDAPVRRAIPAPFQRSRS